MATFLVVGESLVDIVVPADGGPRHDAVGGSCLNVAVGLARLDVPTTLVTRIGDDDLGRLVLEHLAASDVTVSEGSVEPGHSTSTATAHLDAQNSATYDFDLVWDLPVQDLPDDVLGVHVGSLGAALRPGRDAVVDVVRRAANSDVFVSYDPNIRPAFLEDAEAAWADVLEIARAVQPGQAVRRGPAAAASRRRRGGGLPRAAQRRRHRAGHPDARSRRRDRLRGGCHDPRPGPADRRGGQRRRR